MAEMLLAWFEQKERTGNAPDPDELFPGEPEMAEEFRRRVAKAQALDEFIDAFGGFEDSEDESSEQTPPGHLQAHHFPVGPAELEGMDGDSEVLASDGKTPPQQKLVGLLSEGLGTTEGGPAAQGKQVDHSTAQSEEALPIALVGEATLTFLKIGDYRILTPIGQGGTSTVYRAMHQTTQEVVALKILSIAGMLSPSERMRFRGEIALLKQLRHENVVKMLEGVCLEGRLVAVMEYIPGGNLAQRIASGKGLPFAHITEIARTLASALAFVHANGTVHRDLKPQNVLITHEGIPKLTDFGLAKHPELEHSLTPAGAVLGTPAYMPPEYARGLRTKDDPRSDVYGLGAILYHTLTGQPPFRGKDRDAILRQVIHGHPPSPTTIRPEVQVGLAAICLKCLEKDPARRYQSADEVAEALRSYQKSKGWLSGLSARWYLLGRKVRTTRRKRHRLQFACAWSAVVVLMLLVVSFMNSPSVVSTAPEQETDLLRKPTNPRDHKPIFGKAILKAGKQPRDPYELSGSREWNVYELAPKVLEYNYRIRAKMKFKDLIAAQKVMDKMGIYVWRRRLQKEKKKETHQFVTVTVGLFRGIKRFGELEVRRLRSGGPADPAAFIHSVGRRDFDANNEWHEFRIDVRGTKLQAWIDGHDIGVMTRKREEEAARQLNMAEKNLPLVPGMPKPKAFNHEPFAVPGPNFRMTSLCDVHGGVGFFTSGRKIFVNRFNISKLPPNS